jgi:hypothetical protein
VRPQVLTGRKGSSSLLPLAGQVRHPSRSRHLSRSHFLYLPSTGGGNDEQNDVIVVVSEHCRIISLNRERYPVCSGGLVCSSIPTCLSQDQKMTWSCRQRTWKHSCEFVYAPWCSGRQSQVLRHCSWVPSTSWAGAGHKAPGTWVY